MKTIFSFGPECERAGQRLHNPASRINDIVLERRRATTHETWRLAHFFGGYAQSWLNLQTQYDLRVAELDKAAKIAREIGSLAI